MSLDLKYSMYTRGRAASHVALAATLLISMGGQALAQGAEEGVADAEIRFVVPEVATQYDEVFIHYEDPTDTARYIMLREAGSEEGFALHILDGQSPVKLRSSFGPGDFVLELTTGRPVVVLAEAPIRMFAPEATIHGPGSVAAGSSFEVGWVGPDAPFQYIDIVTAGSSGKFLSIEDAKDGMPVTFTAPDKPGGYELRFRVSVNKVITREPFVVTAVSATVTPPARVAPGTWHDIEWTGPANPKDRIAVMSRGESARVISSFPAQRPHVLRMPKEPGEYDLVYLLPGGTVIAREPLIVEAPGESDRSAQ